MERELLLHAALLENEEVLLHGKKWSEEAKARVRQARKAGVSVYDMFSSFYKKSKKSAVKLANKGIGLSEDLANTVAYEADKYIVTNDERSRASRSDQVNDYLKEVVQPTVNRDIKKSTKTTKRNLKYVSAGLNEAMDDALDVQREKKRFKFGRLKQSDSKIKSFL